MAVNQTRNQTSLIKNKRVSADDIRYHEFLRRGRHGYDSLDVEGFRVRVCDIIEELIGERDNAQRFPVADAAAREATYIFARAQRKCEEIVKGAQNHAREVTAEAMARRERIVADAEAHADSIKAEAEQNYPGDVLAQMHYLDAYADVLVGHLRGAAEVLERRRVTAAATADGHVPPPQPAGWTSRSTLPAQDTQAPEGYAYPSPTAPDATSAPG